MAMAKAYSENVKSRMIRRMVGPNAVSAGVLADEVKIHQATLSRWLREASTVPSVKHAGKRSGRGRQRSPATDQPRRPEDWTAREKLQAVMQAFQLSEGELGEWLRSKGLHEAHLREWRDTVTVAAEQALTSPRQRRSSPETKRVKELERELRRKDKALAETAALLVLRKKADALWGDEDASMGPTNDDEFSL
jgi:transposase